MKNKVLNVQQKIATKKPSVVARLWKFVQPYRRIILVWVFALILGGLAVAGWFSYRDWREAAALRLIQSAKEENDYERIAQEYSGTQAASSAMIQLGDMKLKEGKYAEAAEIYERHLSIYPRNLFAPFIRNLLGECYLQEKRYSEAERIFGRLLADSTNDFLHSRAQMNLGRVFLAKGDVQRAIEIYQRLKKEKPNSIWSDSVDGFLRVHKNVQK